MNLRLDLQMLMKRHAGPFLAVCAVLMCLTVAAALDFGATQVESVSVKTGEDDRLLDERYRSFRSLLISQRELESRQKEVIDIALSHALQPGRIDYGAMPLPHDHYRVATLSFPVRGAYKDLRSFLIEVLTRNPALTIENLSIQRANQIGLVEARLRLAFYVTAGEERP